MRSIRNLFFRKSTQKTTRHDHLGDVHFRGALPAPDEPFVAIGDIHGCLTALERIWEHLERQVPGAMIVHVGDYIDRGDNSAEVLKRLQQRQKERGDIVCLIGNHEQMFLDFLSDPERYASRFLRNGGLQTVESLRLFHSNGVGLLEQPVLLRDKVQEVLGEELTQWLRTLQPLWSSGNLTVVHAGADPRLPVDQQSDQNLIWGHRAFGRVARTDGAWIVHGHNVVQFPKMREGVISIDTGAYASGRLTAAIFRPGKEVEFIQVTNG